MRSILRLVLLLLLVLLLAKTGSAEDSEACPDMNKISRSNNLVGAYSHPRAATSEEISRLRTLWQSDAMYKCAGAPADFSKIKVCYVRVQIVNGLNVEYTIKAGKDTLLVSAYFPGSWDLKDTQRISSCQVFK